MCFDCFIAGLGVPPEPPFCSNIWLSILPSSLNSLVSLLQKPLKDHARKSQRMGQSESRGLPEIF
jgi:hypothetical protein